jgi:hypothetical protein
LHHGEEGTWREISIDLYIITQSGKMKMGYAKHDIYIKLLDDRMNPVI